MFFFQFIKIWIRSALYKIKNIKIKNYNNSLIQMKHTSNLKKKMFNGDGGGGGSGGDSVLLYKKMMMMIMI